MENFDFFPAGCLLRVLLSPPKYSIPLKKAGSKLFSTGSNIDILGVKNKHLQNTFGWAGEM